MGNNGVQLPVQEYTDGKLIGTPMIYADYKFSTGDGKAHFKPAPWRTWSRTSSRARPS